MPLALDEGAGATAELGLDDDGANVAGDCADELASVDEELRCCCTFPAPVQNTKSYDFLWGAGCIDAEKQ